MNEFPERCQICGRVLDDDEDVWMCFECGRIVCGDCIDSEERCDECHDRYEENYKRTHGFMF